MAECRIVLLGKTGVGKSSLANTIFGEEVFESYGLSNSVTNECQNETREAHGRKITIIDTPGFFCTKKREEDLRSEMIKCVTLCAPGVNAFLIVLSVGRFTQQEKEVISEIKKSFSEEALKHAVIVFTHGDQLEDRKIKVLLNENDDLRGLAKECGGRCHVVDNKYWDKEGNSNEVKKLLNTIDKMVEQNNGNMYTNEVLKKVESMLEKEKENIRGSSKNMSWKEIQTEAQKRVSDLIKKAVGISTGVLLGALLGVPKMIGRVLRALINNAEEFYQKKGKADEPREEVLKIAQIASLCVSGVSAECILGICCAVGAAEGGMTGYTEAVEANSAGEAAKNTAKVVWESTVAPFKEEPTKHFDAKKD